MRIFGDVGKEVGGVVVFPTVEDVKNWEATNRVPKMEYMKAIAKYYNLPLIDLWDKSGINNYNAEEWYQATGDSCIQVHPDTKGYNRMADVMLQCL
jgi:lysophospholipase L1-like esterase